MMPNREPELVDVDVTIVCRDCGHAFEMSCAEQCWFAVRNLSRPRRCRDCRTRRREQREHQEMSS